MLFFLPDKYSEHMLAVFFLFPQCEQVYVSVSVLRVHSGPLLLQSLCRGCQRCSGGLVSSLGSAPDPECTQAMLRWHWKKDGGTAGQPDPKDSCVFGKTLPNVFPGYTIAVLPVKGWRRWLCHGGSHVRLWPRWQPQYVWLSSCLGQV